MIDDRNWVVINGKAVRDLVLADAVANGAAGEHLANVLGRFPSDRGSIVVLHGDQFAGVPDPGQPGQIEDLLERGATDGERA